MKCKNNDNIQNMVLEPLMHAEARARLYAIILSAFSVSIYASVIMAGYALLLPSLSPNGITTTKLHLIRISVLSCKYNTSHDDNAINPFYEAATILSKGLCTNVTDIHNYTLYIIIYVDGYGLIVLWSSEISSNIYDNNGNHGRTVYDIFRN